MWKAKGHTPCFRSWNSRKVFSPRAGHFGKHDLCVTLDHRYASKAPLVLRMREQASHTVSFEFQKHELTIRSFRNRLEAHVERSSLRAVETQASVILSLDGECSAVCSLGTISTRARFQTPPAATRSSSLSLSLSLDRHSTCSRDTHTHLVANLPNSTLCVFFEQSVVYRSSRGSLGARRSLRARPRRVASRSRRARCSAAARSLRSSARATRRPRPARRARAPSRDSPRGEKAARFPKKKTTKPMRKKRKRQEF